MVCDMPKNNFLILGEGTTFFKETKYIVKALGTTKNITGSWSIWEDPQGLAKSGCLLQYF